MNLEAELARYRAAFVATLPERRRRLVSAVERAADHGSDARGEVELLLHKLAGSAGIHGLAELSNAALAMLRRVGSEAALEDPSEWPELRAVLTAMTQAERPTVA